MAYDPLRIVYGILKKHKDPISLKTDGNFYVTGYIKTLKRIGGDLKVIIRDAIVTKVPVESLEAYAREAERRKTVNVYVSLFRDTQKLHLLS
jgi:hypothetical protein